MRMKLKGTLNKMSNHLKANTYNKKKATKQKISDKFLDFLQSIDR